MHDRIKTFALLLLYGIIITAADLIWIACNRKMYARLIAKVKGAAGGVMSIQLWPSVVAYCFVLAAVYALVLPAVLNASNVVVAVLQSALIGLIIYGIFNSTNIVMFWPSYDAKIANFDILWGITLFGFAGLLGWFLFKSRGLRPPTTPHS